MKEWFFHYYRCRYQSGFHLNLDNCCVVVVVVVVVVVAAAVDNSLEEAAHNLRWAGNIVELVGAVDCTIVVAAAGYMLDAAAVTDTTAAVDFVAHKVAWLAVVVADTVVVVVVVVVAAVVEHAQSVQSPHWRTRLVALGSKTSLPTILFFYKDSVFLICTIIFWLVSGGILFSFH